MGALDVLNHLIGFVLPALVVGPLAAALAKLVWRSALRGVRWRRLALWATLACLFALAGGLVVLGRDGAMATYGAMTLAAAGALYWAGFGPGRAGR